MHNGAGQGTYRVVIKEPFGIPYGCTVARDVSNLMMTGRCISVDHLAFGATRLMNECMVIGQAVGDAASMAIDAGIAPKDVDVKQLRKTLLEQKAILSV